MIATNIIADGWLRWVALAACLVSSNNSDKDNYRRLAWLDGTALGMLAWYPQIIVTKILVGGWLRWVALAACLVSSNNSD